MSLTFTTSLSGRTGDDFHTLANYNSSAKL